MSEDENIYIDDNDIQSDGLNNEIESAGSETTGSAFGGLNEYSNLNNYNSKANMPNRKNHAANLAKNLGNLASKRGKGEKVPEALKNRKNPTPSTNGKRKSGNKDKNNGKDKDSQTQSGSVVGQASGKNKEKGKEKSAIDNVAEKAAEKGGSAALQYFGVPKGAADLIAKKLAGPAVKIAKNRTKMAIITSVASIFLTFLIIVVSISIVLMPILKGLELIDDISDNLSNFFSSAEHWISGDGWCASDAECITKAEDEFYEKVEKVSEKYPNVDMPLVLSSVLYGLNTEGKFNVGNVDYCEQYTDATEKKNCQDETFTTEDKDAIDSNESLNSDEKIEAYKTAKSNISKVAKKLSKGKEEFDTYMVETFIPKNYKEYITGGTTAKQILVEIYMLADIFQNFMKEYGIRQVYISTICPQGINVTAGSDSTRFPAATNLSLEEYVAGSLSSEYNDESEPEVMKAVAIAIRSYFVAHINNGGSCTVKNSTNFQTYREPTETTTKIAEETAGKVITYDGKVIGLHYSIFPGSNADGWSSSTPCENSVCKDGMCKAMLYKEPNNEKTYLTIPQSYGGYNDVSSISNSHCHGMSTLVASYYATKQSYTYNNIINLFVSDGVSIETLATGEQTMPLDLPDPANWRNATSRIYQIGTATCYQNGVAVGKGCNHLGIDFAYGGIGDKPIYAFAPGKVVEATTNYGNSGYGNTVKIGHDINGDGEYDYYSRYGHMRHSPEVSVGDIVGAGTQLGVVGTTGSSTGDHLHFEIYSAAGGKTVDDYYKTRPDLIVDKLVKGERWYE